MASVYLDAVSRVYPGGIVAVRDFNLEVRDHEFVVLVGPSGCGKSTTLRLIAGLEELSAGSIRIGDRLVNGVPPKDRDIAMVFQNYALYPHMSVYRNMAFGLEMRYGSSWLKRALLRLFRPKRATELVEQRRMIDRRVRESARTLDIEDLLDRLPRELSGGERQRVAVGRAIVRQPAAFLFDEPLSNLDARLREELRRELKQLHQRLAATVLYVTHDQVEALTLGDRVVVMDRGVIQQIGAPLEVYERPANRFVAGFIGTPSMNLVAGELAAAGGLVRFRTETWEVQLDKATSQMVQQYAGRGVDLGIRPEHVHLAASSADPAWTGPLAARTRLVEPLGESMIVHLEVGGKAPRDAEAAGRPAAILCRADARRSVCVGSGVEVWFDMRRAHWFDGLTGRNLGLDVISEGN